MSHPLPERNKIPPYFTYSPQILKSHSIKFKCHPGVIIGDHINVGLERLCKKWQHPLSTRAINFYLAESANKSSLWALSMGSNWFVLQERSYISNRFFFLPPTSVDKREDCLMGSQNKTSGKQIHARATEKQKHSTARPHSHSSDNSDFWRWRDKIGIWPTDWNLASSKC